MPGTGRGAEKELYKVKISDNDHFTGTVYSRYKIFRLKAAAVVYTKIMNLFCEARLEE